MSEQGIVYSATGDVYRREACLSAKTVKEVMPNVPITLFSDEPPDCEYIDTFERIDDPAYDYRDKISHLLESPYEKNVYLDTDITLAADISDVFSLLSRFDVAAKHDPERTEREAISLPEVPSAFPEFNTGVIAYRKSEATRAFVNEWLDVYDDRTEENAHDQPFFRKAAYETDIRISALPPEYNCQYAAHPGYVSGEVRVFHGRILDEGVIGDRYKYDPAEVIRKLNASTLPRVYTHDTKFRVTTSERSPISKVVRSLRQRGVGGTVRRAVGKLSSPDS